nr:putative 1-phosphatidylinositol-3-phosphate 5-kinase FAB1D [Ipomoea batatas]
MCHYCGSKSTKSCSSMDKQQENDNCKRLNGMDSVQSCQFCGEMKDKNLTSHGVASISPTISMQSSERSVSSCSEFSVDVNSDYRGYLDESSTDSSQESFNSNTRGSLYGFSLQPPSNGSNLDSSGNNRSAIVENSRVERDSDEETGIPFNVEVDSHFWLPPDPEDRDLDLEGSVANYEDDDDIEGGNGLNLVSFGEEYSGIFKFKEEKQKAMEEVMCGKFKALVAQLLRSVGVNPKGEDSDSWVDIVTALSWNAASFVKVDAAEGKAMDPDGYVKIKCVATGSRNQSQFVKGLVFKKHAAHKHMPTRYKSPRLLLIQGALGLSSNELSSLQSMQQQEKEGLKSFVEILEKYHPNVVLVEKAVSRDVQESILQKGITLVFDMKLHRLERVARCTGSPILSCDTLAAQKLRQCDSFHFEKFIEEHAISREGGRKPNKTLMFIEGCPTRLGCTILLMGSNNDELKRIKCVVRCAVVMAYHLILETSFLLDQRAMFSTISPTHLVTVSTNKQDSTSVGDGAESLSNNEDTVPDIHSTTDIAISDGLHAEGNHNLKSEVDSALSLEPYNPIILSGLSSLSSSLSKVMGESFPILSSSRQSMSSYLGFDRRNVDDLAQTDVQVSNSTTVVNDVKEPKIFPDEEKAPEKEIINTSLTNHEEPLDPQNEIHEDQRNGKDDISTVLDSESILVLMSSRNASKGIMCEHSHFSHIRSSCAKLVVNHLKLIFLTMHTIISNSQSKFDIFLLTGVCQRILMSAAARGLSFGKFLELSFSNSSFFSAPSGCGHSFHRDFVFFFGLGPMAAMFRYSPVATYSVSLPPLKLEFSNPVKGEYLKRDFEKVHSKGIRMFMDIENSLKDIWSHSTGKEYSLQETPKEFIEIEAMLKEERSQFEVGVQNLNNGNGDNIVYKLLSLNRIRLELMLESCVWDRRLRALLSSDTKLMRHRDFQVDNMEHGQTCLTQYDKTGREVNGIETDMERGNDVADRCADIRIDGSNGDEMDEAEISIEGHTDVSGNAPYHDINAAAIPITEIHLDKQVEGSILPDDSSSSCVFLEGGKSPIEMNATGNSLSALDTNSHFGDASHQEYNSPNQVLTDKLIPITCDVGSNHFQRQKSFISMLSTGEDDKGWIWTPFPEIRREFMKDLKRGNLPKFGSVTSHATETVASSLVAEEAGKLHIPLGSDDYIVSDYEDELSSIIACALAFLKDFGDDDRKDKVMETKIYESSQGLMRIFSLSSPHWSASSSSLDSAEGSHSSSGLFDESRSSSFDGLDSLESSVSTTAFHSEVSMGSGKLQGKRKYTVLCTFASQFRQLRDRCCTSEDDYIASLSRCRGWDAKGGKSKSFFAKTLDDRFIIKGIKRTEFDSFMMFGLGYFHYMDQCYEKGNQTCLAKILGVYQVTIRNTKNGKETKHELMVMENLSFGRNITRQYDLKGALHARFNSAGNGAGDVLLDQNFVNDMNVSPLYVSRESKRNLQRAVWNDTGFLNLINVMDYSLLVGVDTERRELVCGIIDYLRQYTWDKQFETWVKSSLVVPKNQLPTVISPIEYKKRFRKFIDTHFISVPDHWCSRRPSNPCQLCGTAGSVDSAHRRSQDGNSTEQEENERGESSAP